MNRWAASGKWDCHFLCICVLGNTDAVSLAKEMGREMKLTDCVNGYIDSPGGMPMKGQLGCSGFIMLDQQMCVLSSCTSSFMRVRGVAFKHVEVLLDAQSQSLPPPKICPGDYVGVPTDSNSSAQPGMCTDIQGDHAVVMMRAGSTAVVPITKLEKIREQDFFESWWLQIFRGFFGTLRRICGSRRSDCGTGSCSSGSCADGCQGNAVDTGAEHADVPSLPSLPSVKVSSMDAEHEQCVRLINLLVNRRSAVALRAVRDELATHFSHEEDLMRKHGWGGDGNDPFSARKSHIEDHQRMLDAIDCELRMGKSGVGAQFIKTLITDFQEHGERYDARYADFLGEREVQ
eukprot:gnl/MRDRNA2_/MRDRNA2_18486_c0_seq1.p1 gnl/MRDRNA2_/MRDRNA2_18486_c0~~gnl/MRDRNA2_/MRDRNA2_18486_c0_seq1.p1  ORF type:complete len:346 (+),score=60.51 gnl/MRDRNA2_/MRDRNA2_18486_c0_seq1:70-1107(+)